MAKDKIAGVPVVPSTTVPDAVPVTTPGVGHSFNFAPPAPEPPKRTKPVSKGDPELQTMARIDRQLSCLPLNTQERIITWLQGRLIENIQKDWDERCMTEAKEAAIDALRIGERNGSEMAGTGPSRGPDSK